jgi:hypothetical protein
MKCPGFSRLIDYLEGKLAATEAGAISAHLDSGCSRCKADRDWYERAVALATSDDSVEPPPWVLNRAIKLFETSRNKPGLVEQVGNLIASLVFDSLARPALVEQRSAVPSSRQLLYKAGDYSIDLVIAQGDQARANVIGQVLREGDFDFECVTGLQLELMSEGRPISATLTNNVGEFAISGIADGKYDLHVEATDVSITIQNLSVAVS